MPRLTARLAIPALAAACLAVSAAAQPADPDAIALPEVAVTGRRRTETVRDIPGGVSVVPGADLAAGTSDPQNDLARRVPNLSFTDNASSIQNQFILRGVGAFSAPFNPADGSVVYSLDRAPFSATGFGTQLVDLQRVEVLRGPQGTLFGRSALGGAVNLVPNPADGTREFTFGQEFGNRGWVQTDAAAAGTLVPGTLFGRGALRFSNRNSDIPNDLGGRVNGRQELTGRGTLRWTPDGLTRFDLSIFGDRDRGDPPRFVLRDAPGFPRVSLDVRERNDRDLVGGLLNASRDLGGAVLSSTTTVQSYRTRLFSDDTDGLLYSRAFGFPAAFFDNPAQDKTDLWQRETVVGQEVRLNSAPGSRLEWVTGVSFFSTDSTLDRAQTNRFFPTLNGRYRTAIDAYDVGVFGDGTYALTDTVKLSGGLRVAHAGQDYRNVFVGNGAPTVVPFFAERASVDDTAVTGRVALSWTPAPEATLFAAVSRGHSPTGFQRFADNAALGVRSSAYDAAGAWSYELGTRLETPDRRGSLDVTAFYTDVSKGPLAAFNPASLTFNIETLDYSSYGLEIEARALLPYDLTASAGVGLQRARLGTVPAGSNSGARSGGRVPNVPDANSFAALEWRRPVEAGRLSGTATARAEVQVVADRSADIQNSFGLRPYSLVNLRVGYDLPSFGVHAFARNLADTRPELAGANFGAAQSVVVGLGRIVGAGATVRF